MDGKKQEFSAVPPEFSAAAEFTPLPDEFRQTGGPTPAAKKSGRWWKKALYALAGLTALTTAAFFGITAPDTPATPDTLPVQEETYPLTGTLYCTAYNDTFGPDGQPLLLWEDRVVEMSALADAPLSLPRPQQPETGGYTFLGWVGRYDTAGGRVYRLMPDPLTAEDAAVMLADPELRELAQEELSAARGDMERLTEELKRLLLPKDPNDEKNVILEIRAGIGGEEGALFAADLLRMYTMYAERRGWTLTVVNENDTELGGVKEVSAEVEGAGVWSRLKFEAGTHRVQRVPETESSGRIQTSAATVAVMPEAEEVEFTIDPKDLQIDTFRSSGAGGQHVNKTESAIRITHLPTGVVVECQDERSQYKNKDRAMKILRSKLYEAEQEKQNAAIAATRKSQVGTGDRSGKIRTYNFPQNRVTDHRLTGDNKNFNIAAIINGDLDDMIDALTLNDQAQRLQEGKES